MCDAYLLTHPIPLVLLRNFWSLWPLKVDLENFSVYAVTQIDTTRWSHNRVFDYSSREGDHRRWKIFGSVVQLPQNI